MGILPGLNGAASIEFHGFLKLDRRRIMQMAGYCLFVMVPLTFHIYLLPFSLGHHAMTGTKRVFLGENSEFI